YYTGPMEKLSVPETLGGMPVTRINFDGRQNRDKITEISLPKTLIATDFLYFSLQNLNNLSSITVADNNPELASKDGVLFTKDFSVLAVYPRAKTDVSYTEPDTVKKSYGFECNRFLKEITFSSNKEYTSVASCLGSSIEKAVIPPNVTEVGESAFENCTSLKEIQWGGNEKIIGRRAFASCTALTDVTLPESVMELEAESFAYCKGLKTIKLPFGLTYIGNGAFSNTTSLKKVTIPDSVLRIGFGAFTGCNARIKKAPYLKKITHKYESMGDVSYSYTYSVMAKVTKKGKVNNYAPGDITGIKADKKTVSVKKGEKTTLNTIVYINGKKKGTLDSSILSYKSGNKAVAKVTEKGVVNGIKKGTAKVLVKLRTTGKSYYVKVRVK
ncbi:MAG: leucine-rich repeat domain-containing protein, partial [Lachnospiraceae bacterium]|nr:leucine-rich repeat domain-containing protein [Lachnospiraceae bacterium]